MKRMTRLKTSPDTLLPPGEGLKKITTSSQLKQKRQAAEMQELNESGASNSKKFKMLEKHLRENRKW